MGAIQNSINQILGSVTGAAVAGTHIAESLEKKEEQGLLAKQQYHEAKADLTELKGKSAEAEETLATSNKLSEKKAAELAFKELTDRIEARKAVMDRAEKIMKRTGTWGGIK